MMRMMMMMHGCMMSGWEEQNYENKKKKNVSIDALSGACLSLYGTRKSISRLAG